MGVRLEEEGGGYGSTDLRLWEGRQNVIAISNKMLAYVMCDLRSNCMLVGERGENEAVAGGGFLG